MHFNAQPYLQQNNVWRHLSFCVIRCAQIINYKLMFHIFVAFFVSGNSLKESPYLRIGQSNVLLALVKSQTGLHLSLSSCNVNQDVRALWRLTSKHGNKIRTWIRTSATRLGSRRKSNCQKISVLNLVGSSRDQWSLRKNWILWYVCLLLLNLERGWTGYVLENVNDAKASVARMSTHLNFTIYWYQNTPDFVVASSCYHFAAFQHVLSCCECCAVLVCVIPTLPFSAVVIACIWYN